MGIDYRWAGSASYPRFGKELCAVAEVFGGNKTERLFIFPKETNKTLVTWFNNIYAYFTISETKTIWELVSQHPEVEKISYQIWTELKECVEYETGWQIY